MCVHLFYWLLMYCANETVELTLRRIIGVDTRNDIRKDLTPLS